MYSHFLRTSCKVHDIPLPTWLLLEDSKHFVKTSRTFKSFNIRKWGIKSLCQQLGVTCFNHHDALADCTMLKQILFKLEEKDGGPNLNGGSIVRFYNQRKITKFTVDERVKFPANSDSRTKNCCGFDVACLVFHLATSYSQLFDNITSACLLLKQYCKVAFQLHSSSPREKASDLFHCVSESRRNIWLTLYPSSPRQLLDLSCSTTDIYESCLLPKVNGTRRWVYSHCAATQCKHPSPFVLTRVESITIPFESDVSSSCLLSQGYTDFTRALNSWQTQSSLATCSKESAQGASALRYEYSIEEESMSFTFRCCGVRQLTKSVEQYPILVRIPVDTLAAANGEVCLQYFIDFGTHRYMLLAFECLVGACPPEIGHWTCFFHLNNSFLSEPSLLQDGWYCYDDTYRPHPVNYAVPKFLSNLTQSPLPSNSHYYHVNTRVGCSLHAMYISCH